MAKGKAPAFQWYPADYIRDTRALHPISRGLWADCLNFMHFSDPRGVLTGTIDQFSRMLSCCNADVTFFLDEIKALKVANVTESNGIVTIINRRIYREDKARQEANARVAKHRESKGKKRKCNENETTHSSSSSSNVIKKEDASLCNGKKTRANGKREAKEVITEIKQLIKFKEYDPRKSIHCLVFNKDRMVDDPIRDQVLQKFPCPNDNFKRQEWFGVFEQEYTKAKEAL